MKEVVYFEFNNWSRGKYYPDEVPFIEWMENDLDLKFQNEKFVKDNKLCVVRSIVDMSVNFCVTATKEWVEKSCPKLLTEYQKFIRKENKYGDVYGNFGDEFLTYSEDNIGIHWATDDEDE